MNSQELFSMINRCVDEMDYIYARRLMEDNVEVIMESKHRLKGNARELFEFVVSTDGEMITQSDIQVIHVLNTHAAHFDVRSFKWTLKENAVLMSKKDTLTYLNEDAKALLESMSSH